MNTLLFAMNVNTCSKCTPHQRVGRSLEKTVYEDGRSAIRCGGCGQTVEAATDEAALAAWNAANGAPAVVHLAVRDVTRVEAFATPEARDRFLDLQDAIDDCRRWAALSVEVRG